MIISEEILMLSNILMHQQEFLNTKTALEIVKSYLDEYLIEGQSDVEIFINQIEEGLNNNIIDTILAMEKIKKELSSTSTI